MIQTVADKDITYDLASEDRDWRHRMTLRQRAVVKAADEELLDHLGALELHVVGGYQDWCLQHGFAPLLGKSRRQQKRERDYFALLREQETLVYNPAHQAAYGVFMKVKSMNRTRLVEAIIDTPLGMSFRNSDFWDTVLTFCVRQRGLNRGIVGAFVDYLEAQRFERKEVADQCDGPLVFAGRCIASRFSQRHTIDPDIY